MSHSKVMKNLTEFNSALTYGGKMETINNPKYK